MIGKTIDTAPDSITPLLGFRGWSSFSGKLHPPYRDKETSWKPGTNHARCLKNSCRAAPQEHCECGLYAYHFPEYVADLDDEQIIGAIKMWGTLQVHEDGTRAERAEIVALAKPRFRPLWVMAALLLLVSFVFTLTAPTTVGKAWGFVATVVLLMVGLTDILPRWKSYRCLTKEAKLAAHRYQVPLVHYNNLERVASKHGDIFNGQRPFDDYFLGPRLGDSLSYINGNLLRY